MKIQLNYEGKFNGKKILVGVAVLAIIAVGVVVWQSEAEDRYIKQFVAQAQTALE